MNSLTHEHEHTQADNIYHKNEVVEQTEVEQTEVSEHAEHAEHVEGTESTEGTDQDYVEPRQTILSVNPDTIQHVSQTIESVFGYGQQENVPVLTQFDLEDGIEENRNLLVLPIHGRDKESKKQYLSRLVLAAIPKPEFLLNDSKHAQFIFQLINDHLISKIKTAANKVDLEKLDQATLPYDLSELCVIGKVNAYAGFKCAAPIFIAALKEQAKKRFKRLNAEILSQVLSSAQFAEIQFRSITQENWEQLLRSMIAYAESEGHAAGIMQYWLETRDEEVPEIDDVEDESVDFDGLAGLIGNKS